jgi:phage shock protein PspC (stress-responsive transcriptional regulator)
LPRRLLRDTRRGLVGGVAAGFGRYLDVDPVLVRVALVLLAFANGIGVLFYLVCWALIPRDPEGGGAEAAPSGAEAVREAGRRFAEEVRANAPGSEHVRAALGGMLILIGGLLLADNLGWLRWPRWANVETLWPLLLVAFGAGLLMKSRRAPARTEN